MKCPFVSQTNFLDLVVDDPTYKTKAMQDIVREKYQISKRMHTSFVDLDKVTYMERQSLLQLIIEDLEEQRRLLETAKAARVNTQ